MSGFEIEKGIPVPEYAGRGGRTNKYPWEDMEVGDSFFVPAEGKKSPPRWHHRKERGERYHVRRMEGGWRVWRLE
jgi:hypothetical protein